MLPEREPGVVETRRGRLEMERVWTALGAVLALLGVAAGALGAHALSATLDADALDIFETAVRFQMYHALALLATGILAARWASRLVNLAASLFTLGIVFFSGSLYLLALSGIGVFGATAPIGGASFLLGWASLLAAALRR